MNASLLPLGPFKCQITLTVVRPAIQQRHEEGGVTFLLASDYELAYSTVLQFSDGRELPIAAKLFAVMNKQLVLRNAEGQPARVVGYAQGRSEIWGTNGDLLFEGHYYDTRLSWDLTGDETFTPAAVRSANHWENSFGSGDYAGHAFSLGVHFTKTATTPMGGEATGRIE